MRTVTPVLLIALLPAVAWAEPTQESLPLRAWVGFLAVRIPLAYLFTAAFGLGLYGAWLAMAADLLVRGAFFWRRFAGGRWQQMRV